MSIIKGKVYVLGDNIDTDQIIPAQYLVYQTEGEEAKKYGELAMSGLPVDIMETQPFVEKGEQVSEYKVVVGGKNFGCGSSREHAPLALAMAGIDVIIAEEYARIFYRNSVDGGFLTPYETPNRIIESFSTNEEVEVDIETNTIRNITRNETHNLKDLGSVKEIVKSGGIFEYARKNELIK